MGVGLLSKLIQCNDFKCPAPSRFDTRIGPGQGQRNNVNQLMNMVSGISDGLSGPNLPSVFATPDPDPNSIAALAGGCDSNVLRCGPPIVEFFGGTPGLGGFGNAVINNIGQIIGVNILDPGMGYTKENPPYVTFRDSCGDGQGAAGTAIIDDNGSIEAVLMDYPGYNYNPTYGKVKTVSGDIEPNVVPPEGVSVTPQIDSVIVNNSGSGYIVFSIKDGAGNYCNTAEIRSHVDGTPGNNDSPGDLSFRTTPDGTCQATERIRIASNGDIIALNNIGVNVPSPQITKGIQISKTGGNGGVSSTYSVANQYLHLGSAEYNSSGGLFSIGFGYINTAGNTAQYAPAYLGFKEKKANPNKALSGCIDLKKSFMIGDTDIDVLTGKRAGLKTILVKSPKIKDLSLIHI